MYTLTQIGIQMSRNVELVISFRLLFFVLRCENAELVVHIYKVSSLMEN